MIVQGGIPTVVDYTTFDQNPDLFIQASVYDVTGDEPSLVTQVPMTYVASGCYIAKFTPLYNRIYVVIKVVFLDDGFTEIDPTRAPDTDDIQALALQDFTGADIIGTVLDC